MHEDKTIVTTHRGIVTMETMNNSASLTSNLRLWFGVLEKQDNVYYVFGDLNSFFFRAILCHLDMFLVCLVFSMLDCLIADEKTRCYSKLEQEKFTVLEQLSKLAKINK